MKPKQKTQDPIEERLLGIESRLEEIRQGQNHMFEFAETRSLIRKLENLLIKIDDKLEKIHPKFSHAAI